MKKLIWILGFGIISNIGISQIPCNIYPNPAYDIVNYHCDSIQGDLTYEIFNTMGERILSNRTTQYFDNNINQIDITKLSMGMYIVNICTDDTPICNTNLMVSADEYIKENKGWFRFSLKK